MLTALRMAKHRAASAAEPVEKVDATPAESGVDPAVVIAFQEAQAELERAEAVYAQYPNLETEAAVHTALTARNAAEETFRKQKARAVAAEKKVLAAKAKTMAERRAEALARYEDAVPRADHAALREAMAPLMVRAALADREHFEVAKRVRELSRAQGEAAWHAAQAARELGDVAAPATPLDEHEVLRWIGYAVHESRKYHGVEQYADLVGPVRHWLIDKSDNARSSPAMKELLDSVLAQVQKARGGSQE
jgi:hypothetical protein